MRFLVLLLVFFSTGCATTPETEQIKVTVTGKKVPRESIDAVGTMNAEVLMIYIQDIQTSTLGAMSYILSDNGAPEAKRGDTKSDVISKINESNVQIVEQSSELVTIISDSYTKQISPQVIYKFEESLFKKYEISKII